MMNRLDVETIISEIKFRDWKFKVNWNDRPYLQIEFIAPDTHNENSLPELQFSRKWWLSPHMCENEIVRTAYKAVKTAIEHEMDEQFTFKKQRIFDPHMDYTNLAALLDQIGTNNRS